MENKEFEELNQITGSIGDKNDCAVKAIAFALDISYFEAHALCHRVGRKKKRGMTSENILKIISRDYQVIEVPWSDLYTRFSKIFPKRKCITTKDITQLLNPESTYIVFVSKHVYCVKNGVVMDGEIKGSRVQQVFRIDHNIEIGEW